jgi:hypothetical protein
MVHSLTIDFHILRGLVIIVVDQPVLLLAVVLDPPRNRVPIGFPLRKAGHSGVGMRRDIRCAADLLACCTKVSAYSADLSAAFRDPAALAALH